MDALSASPRTLEVTVISGEDLRPFPVKNAFVTVRSDAGDAQIATGTEKQRRSDYVEWGEKMTVKLPIRARHLMVEVHCRTFTGIRSIGVAKIPTSDFLGGLVPENYMNFLSYRLRDKGGIRNGIINLSIRVEAEDNLEREYCRPCTAAAAPGVVTGVPVCWPSQF
ncbi:unnamed protein product [Cuscuta campestris]|uniref:C2 domain-containing protein n=1 Tax=Cuscuta campestris TaxID=132261 RepID=A0A484N1B5_9ASTE|nr:unnamed protein product [Cuscuta campestris]